MWGISACNQWKKGVEEYDSETTESKTDELPLKTMTLWLIEMLNLKWKIMKIIIQI